MLEVTVSINGRPIIHRSAVNRSAPGLPDNVPHTYKIDDGRTISHTRKEGAASLAIKMLCGVHLVDINPPDLEAFLLLHGVTNAPRKITKPKKK